MTTSTLPTTQFNPPNNPTEVSVILPTYNERDNICDLIAVLQTHLEGGPWRYELLVVDDDSPDGTADVVRNTYGMHAGPLPDEWLATTEDGASQVRIIVRKQNRGLAASVWEGLERSAGDTLVVMDTDFNHDPAMIPQMVDLLRYYDMVIGSRFVMKGGMDDAIRYQFSYLYNVFIRMLFQLQIQDNLSGFFAIRRHRMQQLQPYAARIFYGYGDYFIRMLNYAWRNNWTLLEVPVYYNLRRHGDSKTGFWDIFVEYTVAVMRLRLLGL